MFAVGFAFDFEATVLDGSAHRADWPLLPAKLPSLREHGQSLRTVRHPHRGAVPDTPHQTTWLIAARLERTGTARSGKCGSPASRQLRCATSIERPLESLRRQIRAPASPPGYRRYAGISCAGVSWRCASPFTRNEGVRGSSPRVGSIEVPAIPGVSVRGGVVYLSRDGLLEAIWKPERRVNRRHVERLRVWLMKAASFQR
jgi:hypothetical protein